MKTAEMQSLSDYESTPTGQCKRWSDEMSASKKELDRWLKKSQKIVDRFLDARRSRSLSNDEGTRINIFTSTVQTVRAMLYANVPVIDVKRQYDDANDDPARVAAIILRRMLNLDMAREVDNYDDALRQALDDRLTVGLAVGRVRYTAEFEEREVPPMLGPDGMEMAPGYTEEIKVSEDALIEYTNWRDIRWSPARVWSEVRWIAFRAYLTKDEMKKRFGEKIAGRANYVSQPRPSTGTVDAMRYDPWQRCEVWEIWSKEERKVYWWTDGMEVILDEQDDPLGLEGFWPCPRFMIANVTTSSLVPRPDFDLWEDLYNEIDYVSTRITLLERAVKAVGVYDASAVGVKRMLQEGVDNDLIPVDNWGSFSEAGGLNGAVQWMPLADIVSALDVLRGYRTELIDLLYQVSGLSDIMRGQSTQPNVTATEQGMKAHYASLRISALQDQFADFAAGLQQLKAEVISKHFDDETIVTRSNIMATPDGQMVPAALQLLRDRTSEYRIQVNADDITRADYATAKGERVEYLTAVSTFLQTAWPMAEAIPAAAPVLLQMLQFATAAFRGGQQMEGVLDQAIMQMQQQPAGGGGKPKEPDPAEAEKIKQQTEQMKIQGRMREQQLKAHAQMQEIRAKAEADLMKVQAELQSGLLQTQAETGSQVVAEQAQFEFNIAEEERKAEVAVAEHLAKIRATAREKPQA